MGMLRGRKSKMNIEEERPPKNAVFRIMAIGSAIMIATAVLCGIFFTIKMRQVNTVDKTEYVEYTRHYAFITEDTEKKFWDEVYLGAVEEAEKDGVYVERMGEALSGNYSTSDLLRMAIDSSVDGIIFNGPDNKETKELLEKASTEGIFVVVLRQDNESSDRQCFVGVNNYDLGQAYGQQILHVLNGEIQTQKVCILMDSSTSESSQNIITLAIRDTVAALLGQNAVPEIEIKQIDTTDAFSAEEGIRDVLMNDKNLPDIIVCMNSVYTQCAYQAAVDYNLVGDIKIIGYYSSESILDAIEKQIIFSTICVETEEMGKLSVQAQEDHFKSGYTNSYVPVSIQVIGQKEAKELLNEKTVETASEE